MTRHVVAVAENTPLRKIARLLEKHHIKRVPVMREGRLIGSVGRANLLHGLAAKGADCPRSSNDQLIREQLLHALSDEAGLNMALINFVVVDGTVQIWGIVDSANEKTAAHVAAENIAGVKTIDNHLGQVPAWAWAD